MVEIRPGRPEDGTRLRKIQAATIAQPWPELLDAALVGPPPLHVAVDGTETPVGYAIVVPGSGSVAYVPELAIAPQRQGEGVGSALLDAVCDSLREDGYEELRLTVREIDDGARAFYRDNGFEKLDHLPDHFENCDGFLLGRPF